MGSKIKSLQIFKYHFVLITDSCLQDSDCDTANCFYCLSNGKCRKFDTEYCDSTICGKGDGDCDSTDPCPSGLVCGKDNFLDFHPLLESCTKTSISEVCIEGKIITFEIFDSSKQLKIVSILTEHIFINLYLSTSREIAE